MLDIHNDDGPDTKFYFSHSVLPGYIDPQNVSTKKKPFSTFNAQPFSHTVHIPAAADKRVKQFKKLMHV
jgi:ribonuclease P/MRP protein subunit RPP40